MQLHLFFYVNCKDHMDTVMVQNICNGSTCQKFVNEGEKLSQGEDMTPSEVSGEKLSQGEDMTPLEVSSGNLTQGEDKRFQEVCFYDSSQREDTSPKRSQI